MERDPVMLLVVLNVGWEICNRGFCAGDHLIQLRLRPWLSDALHSDRILFGSIDGLSR